MKAGKTVSPPLLPQDTLSRVLRTASVDGRILLIVASTFALLAAAVREAPATVAGVLAAGAGALELHGVSLLRRGELRGMRWLVSSQLFLLLVVLGYVGVRLSLLTAEAMAALITPDIEAQARASGWTPSELSRFMHQLAVGGYIAVAVITCCYQGGMAWYFHRRRGAVAKALGEPT